MAGCRARHGAVVSSGIEVRGPERRARARAIAASIADTPRLPRRLVVDDDTVLRPSPRRRASAPRPRATTTAAPNSRRGLALLVLGGQLAVLVALFVLPPFRISRVEVSGTSMLRADVVRAAAGVRSGQSIFTVDGEAVRARLEHLPWVRAASVDTALPATVRITVREWTPILRVRSARGDTLVAPSGARIDAAMIVPGKVPNDVPVLVDLRPTSTPLSATLGRTLAAVASAFPSVVGCSVARFEWQADGRLAIVAAPGWRAILGYVDLPRDVDTIPEQIAALAALRARVDLLHPTFGYVDLSDPTAPAIGGTPGR